MLLVQAPRAASQGESERTQLLYDRASTYARELGDSALLAEIRQAAAESGFAESAQCERVAEHVEGVGDAAD